MGNLHVLLILEIFAFQLERQSLSRGTDGAQCVMQRHKGPHNNAIRFIATHTTHTRNKSFYKGTALVFVNCQFQKKQFVSQLTDY